MLFYVLSLPRYKSFDLMVDDIMFSNGLLYSLEIYLSAVNLQVFTDRSLKQMQTTRVQIQLPEVKTLQPFLLLLKFGLYLSRPFLSLSKP